MNFKNKLYNFLQNNTKAHKAGFAAVCFMSGLILSGFLYRPFYTADISDVFNLSMDILGAVVCSMLYYGCLASGKTSKKDIYWYYLVLFVNTLIFLLDSIAWLVNGIKSLIPLNVFVSTLFYGFTYLLMYLLWKHSCTILKPEKEKLQKIDKIHKFLLSLFLLPCFINLFMPVLFEVDQDGVFHRAFAYSFGSFYIIVSFIILIVMTYNSDIEKWRKAFVIIPAFASIMSFVVLLKMPKFAISYTVSITAVIIVNCILYEKRVRMKELIVRVFSTLLLCTMLLYGPFIYKISSLKAVDDGYQSVSEAFPLVSQLIDETGLDRICDPANTELYQTTRNKLRTICHSLGLQNLYVEYVDPEKMVRVYILAVAASDEEDAYIKENLGWPGASIWTEESYITIPELIVMEGDITDIYSEQDNEYGHNLDWFYPYFDGEGKVAAIIGADIDAGIYQTQSIKQFLQDIAPAIVLFFITLLVLLNMIEHIFLKPFYLISRHMQGFMMNGVKNNEKLSVSGSYEIWFLAKSFDLMTSELEEYEEARTREIQEKQRLSTELELSATIQSQYLPRTFPPYPDRTEFDIYASMNPAKEVAGDFYDFFFIDPDRFAIVIADVSGKGLPAALFMMRSKTVIRTVAEHGHSPAEILEKVNISLCEGNDKKMFVSVWLSIIDLKTGVMKCSNAGHEYPFIRKAEGDYELFEDPHSPILGLRKKLKPTEYEVILSPGDSVFVYTDGIPEAVDVSDRLYGVERLKEALNKNKEADMKDLLNGVTMDCEDYTSGAEQFDDITMLGFRFLGFHDR